MSSDSPASDGRRLDLEPLDLFSRLRALTRDLPPGLELHRLLQNLDDPANDEQSKDRYTALIAAGAVEEGLRGALEREEPAEQVPRSFHDKIERAQAIGIVTGGEAVELHKLRLVRNVFAHSLAPIGFDEPAILEATRGLWDHPVTDFAAWFAPAFAPRQHFAIVCGEFYQKLARVR